ncbi:DUF3616 domain-containing protein [Rhizobium ruizarguesonis]|nr:DUF3616 domain-containing protein [Rhizobium ruizarguesonis]TAU45861.1 DUF3616 domain-containing protein [Rhizobium ruizarguesonis]
MRRHRASAVTSFCAAGVTTLFSVIPSFAADPLSPKTILKVSPELTDSEESTNVSGAACAVLTKTQTSCLLIGDEVKWARFFKLDENQLVPGEQVYLLPKKHDVNSALVKYKETDAEGISFHDGYYYLIGSHGLNKSGEFQDSRYFLYRMKVDASSGLAKDFGTEDRQSSDVEKTANLQKALADDPTFKDHVKEKPDVGVNIEGLAVSGDDIYIGFRSPLPNGDAVIASVPIKDAFENSEAKLKPHPADLGTGMGVRDIAAVDDGFLILSGPQADKAGPAGVCFWKASSPEAQCHDLKKAGPDDSKPEALAVLGTTKDHYEVLIMSDGPSNGAPAIYEVPR